MQQQIFRLEEILDDRAAWDGKCLAPQEVPGALDKAQPERQAALKGIDIKRQNDILIISEQLLAKHL